MCPKPAKEDPRITKCITAKRESKSVEFKEQFDPTDAQQALEVLKDLVSIANSGGGTLVVGINNAGQGCGSDVRAVLEYDNAKYCDIIKKFTMLTLGIYGHVIGNQQRHAVENRSARIEKFGVN